MKLLNIIFLSMLSLNAFGAAALTEGNRSRG